MYPENFSVAPLWPTFSVVSETDPGAVTLLDSGDSLPLPWVLTARILNLWGWPPTNPLAAKSLLLGQTLSFAVTQISVQVVSKLLFPTFLVYCHFVIWDPPSLSIVQSITNC